MGATKDVPKSRETFHRFLFELKTEQLKEAFLVSVDFQMSLAFLFWRERMRRNPLGSISRCVCDWRLLVYLEHEAGETDALLG